MPEKAIWMTTSSGPGSRRANLKGARWPLPSMQAQPSELPVPSAAVHDAPFFCSAAATWEKLSSPARMQGRAQLPPCPSSSQTPPGTWTF